MKYCLSARQSSNLLKKADEIKIELRDFKAIIEYVEDYPDKTLILEFENALPEDFDWEGIAAYNEMMKGNFICALSDLSMAPECYLRGIKFYYKYPATSFFEVKGLVDLGVCYILVGTPLMFNLEALAAYNVPLRAIPNLAYEPYISYTNGIIGGWVRPEDIPAYEEYIDVFEFYAPKDYNKEAALYHVYAENGNWPGNLRLLIDFFDHDFDNRLLYDEEGFAHRRMNCGQKCLINHSCHYCENQILFPSTTLKKYLDYKNNN